MTANGTPKQVYLKQDARPSSTASISHNLPPKLLWTTLSSMKNPNKQQKYKIIFRFNFLINNEFDFFLSEKVVKWQGYKVSIFNDNEVNNENNTKEIKGNNYKKMTSHGTICWQLHPFTFLIYLE